MQPTYEPKEVYPQNWTAKVIVLEQTFEATGLFPNKDQALEMLQLHARCQVVELYPLTTNPLV